MAENTELATSSPATKDELRNKYAYYFDDDRLGIIQLQKDGEWKSITTTGWSTTKQTLIIQYHARYNKVEDLTQNIGEDSNTAPGGGSQKGIGLKVGLHLALLDYIRARLAEDNQDEQKAIYYYGRFRQRVKSYPFRRSAVRGILPYNLQ
tara:strand:- start:16811 stop:17260 length:450 start_codon:yes stop_codon:yes gene_type:complete